MKTDSSNNKLIQSDHSTDDILVNVGDNNEEHEIVQIKTPILNIYKDFFTFSYLPIFAVISSLISGSSPIIQYSLLGKIVNILTKWNKDQSKDPLKDIIKTCILISILVIASSISTFYKSLLWTRVGYKFSNKLRKDLFHNLMMSDVSFFDSNSIGTLLALLSEDSENVQNSFGSIKGGQIFNLSKFIAGTFMCLFYSWKMPLISFILFIPITYFWTKYFTNKIDDHNQLKFCHLANSITITEETISSVKTVRSFNAEQTEIQRYLCEIDKVRSEEKVVHKFCGFMYFGPSFLLWTLMFLNIYTGGIMIYEGKIEPGYMITIFGMIYFCGFGMIDFLYTFPEEQKALASCVRILDMTMNCASSSTEMNMTEKVRINDFKGKIEFVDVSFKYPTRDVYVLNHVSFTVFPAQICAFVGHSGSGKSTVVQLIEGFYFVGSGSVLIDDVDIRDIDLNWLHQKIGLVSQDPVLFQMSVRENIVYGLQTTFLNVDEIVENAVEIANLKNFVNKYSFDYIVGQKGTSISGGQKQRIAIARAVVKDPVILITDEATSSLDSNNERKVQDALNKVMKNRTAVVVAHRLSTIKQADYIFVFVNGEIKEKGNHLDLIQQKGFYFDLVKKQL